MGAYAIGTPLAVGGIILHILAIVSPLGTDGMTDVQIQHWAPDADPMPPGAGEKIMFRVDTTLDEPIQTTVLCGACGTLTRGNGPRPASYICPSCGVELWEEE